MSGGEARRALPRYALAIFDCDGVLVDSERIANEVFAACLRELGLDVSLEDMFERFVGHSMANCMLQVREMLGHEPPAGFLEDLQRRNFEAFRCRLEPVEGVIVALDAIEPVMPVWPPAAITPSCA